METTEIFAPKIAKLQSTATIMAIVGAVLFAAGFVMEKELAFSAYLYAYIFWAGVTIGSLGLLLLHHTVGGGWGYIIRRPVEASTRLFPIIGILGIPVLLGMHTLFSWSRPEAVSDPIYLAKQPYLNVPFFIARFVIYLAIWMLLARIANKWGSTFNQNRDERVFDRLNKLGAGGIVVMVLTITFFAFDWIMSLDYHWYSSIVGLLYTATMGLSAMSMMLILVAALAGDHPIIQKVPKGFFRDLGNLTLAMIMLWGYTSVSQWIITYHGNTAEEIAWYIDRNTGGWQWVARFLMPFHFALPFLVLLVGSNVKKDPRKLANVAKYIVALRLIDLYWWIVPTFRHTVGIGPAEIGAPLLIGGIWLYFFCLQIRNQPLVPQFDPRLEGQWPLREEVAHHG